MAVLRAANQAKRFIFTDVHFPDFLAGEVQDHHRVSNILHVGDKHAVAGDQPVADGHIAFGNDINPFVFSIFAKANLDDAAVRRIAICNGQDPVIHQSQAKHVIDSAKNSCCWSFLAKRLQINVRNRLAEKVIDEESQPFLVGEQG